MKRPANAKGRQHAKARPGARVRRTTEQVRDAARRLVAERGGTCEVPDNANEVSRIAIRCAEGHVWRPRIRFILHGTWCPFCAKATISAKLRRRTGALDLDDADEIALYAESIGLAFVANGTTREGRADFFRCGDGHMFEVARDRRTGAWCPACGGRGTELGVGRSVR